MSDANLLYAITAFLLIALATISITHPFFLLENEFLVGFINHELVNVLAVTTTVTMAWSGHLLYILVDLEGEHELLEFPRLKASLKRNIVFLGVYFTGAVILLVIESALVGNHELRACIFSLLLLLLFMNIVSMIQTHMIAFQMPTKKEIRKLLDENS